MIDRRAFLRRLGFGTVAAAAAACSTFDVERLLWLPEKTIILPPEAIFAPVRQMQAARGLGVQVCTMIIGADGRPRMGMITVG